MAKKPAGKKPAAAKGSQSRTAAYENGIQNYNGKVVLAFTGIMLVIFSLFTGPYGYAEITASKYYFFVCVTLALLVALAAVYLGMFLDGYRPNIRVFEGVKKLSVSKWFSVLFLFMALLSALLSPYKEYVNDSGLNSVLFGSSRHEGLAAFFLYLCIYWCVSSWGKFTKWILIAVSGITVIFTAIGIMQFFGGNPLELYAATLSYASLGGMFFSTIGNVNMVSGLLCMLIPLLAVGFIVLDGKWRYFLLPGIFFGVYAELTANSESGYVGFAVAALLLLPLLLNTGERFFRTCIVGLTVGAAAAIEGMISARWPDVYQPPEVSLSFTPLTKYALILAGVCLVAGAIAFFIKNKVKIKPIITTAVLYALILAMLVYGVVFLKNRVYAENEREGMVYEASQVLNGTMNDEFGNGRGFIWTRSIEMALEKNPWLGTGPDTFTMEFNSRYYDDIQRVNPGAMYDAAHNEYIQIFCNLGILGLAAYLLFLFSLAIRAFSKVKKNPLVLVLGAAALTYAIQAFFSFSIAIHTPIFWLILGMLEREIRRTGEGAPLPDVFESVPES